MRENRKSGSEGGGAESNRLFLPLSLCQSSDCWTQRTQNCHDGNHDQHFNQRKSAGVCDATQEFH